jgi:hypothetical protein
MKKGAVAMGITQIKRLVDIVSRITEKRCEAKINLLCGIAISMFRDIEGRAQ